MSEGLKEIESLRSAGFSENEITQWQSDTTRELTDAGFSGVEIDDYFGVKQPNMAPVKDFVNTNLKALATLSPQPVPEGTGAEGVTAPEGGIIPKQADDLIDALEAGLQISSAGLLVRGKLPDTVMPEHADMAMRIANQVGMLAGDFPAMVGGGMFGGAVGGVAGGAAGSAIPVLGNAVGAAAGATLGSGAGAFALPAAMRTALMQAYEKGEVKDFGDFWERTSAVFLEAYKQGQVGALTGGMGAGVAGTLAGNVVVPAIAKAGAVTASEIATMVTVGKAIEGEMPQPQDFADAAILVMGMHAAGAVGGKAASKIRNVYAKTGVKPEAIIELMQKDPTIREDLVSTNVEIPRALEKYADGKTAVGESAPETVTVEIPKELTGGVPTKPLAVELPKPKVQTPERTPEAQAILDRIGTAEKPSSIPSLDQVYTNVIDKFHPVEVAVRNALNGKELSVKENPYALLRLAADSTGKASHFIDFGTLDFKTLKKNGQSLKEAVAPVKGDVDGLTAHMMAARALELETRGVKTGIPLKEAEAVMKQSSSAMKQAAKNVVEFQNKVLKYAKDAGLIKPETFDNVVDAHQDYIPFHRIVDGEAGGKKGGVRNPLREIRGSEKEFVNPMESVVRNVHALIKMAEQNRARLEFLKFAKKNPDTIPLEKVTHTQVIEVKAEEVTRALEDQGLLVTKEAIRRNLEEKGIKVTDKVLEKALEHETEIATKEAQAFDIYRAQSLPLAKDEFAVMVEGKREVYRTTPEIAESIKMLDGSPAAQGLFMKMLSLPASWLRASLALTPDFITRNMIRDQTTAGVFSKGGTIPFVDSLRAMGNLIKKDEVFQSWLKSGGTNASIASLDRQYIANDVFQLAKETNFTNRVINVLKHPLEPLRVASELIENSTRLAEFKRVVGDPASASAGKIMEGGFASREVTVDFKRIGAKMQALNAITAFMNVGVQGLDRTVRAFKENPQGMLTRATAMVTVPSVLLWWANHDDPRWSDIPQWQKDLFWIVMTEDHIYRIPKPQELGLIFGSLPERTLEAFFNDNPHAYEDFGKTIMETITPNVMPTGLSPIAEQITNHSFFTGNKLIPSSYEGLFPDLQYTEYTSQTARLIGQAVGTLPGGRDTTFASPMVIENYVRSWSGNTGMYALQLLDRSLTAAGLTPDPKKPKDTLADIPFIKAFVIRYPSSSAESIQDFYARYEKQAETIKSIRHLAKTGDLDAVEREMALAQQRMGLAQLDGIRDALTNSTKAVRMIYKDPSMSPDEKRQLIDALYYNMIGAAKIGNQGFDTIEKSARGN